jgi:type IV secretory pathway VirB2 component (pilin)
MLSSISFFHFLVTISGGLPDINNQNINYNPPGSAIQPTESMTSILGHVAGWMTGIIGTIAVILVIIGGIQYAMALGDQEKINTSKRTILYAVVGLIIALLSYVIVPLVAKLFQ